MDEAEWLECTDPERMLAFLRGAPTNWRERLLSWLRARPTAPPPSQRKYRLFLCACCRGSWHLLAGDVSRQAVLVAERFADGDAERAEMDAARQAALEVAACLAGVLASPDCQADQRDRIAAHLVAVNTTVGGGGLRQSALSLGSLLSEDVCATLLRDLFGNPFYPVTLNRAWRTPTVVFRAQAAYDDRILPSGHLDPDRLAIMADALEDAGCDSADILSHLRGPGPHVRGCWVVDLLLGKE